jgi:hypothetical protein
MAMKIGSQAATVFGSSAGNHLGLRERDIHSVVVHWTALLLYIWMV